LTPKAALSHLPVQDIIKAANGPKGNYEEMITRKPNWTQNCLMGGLYHDKQPLIGQAFLVVSWF